MFEKALKDSVKTIFGLKKATYDLPSPETQEQECLFIEIEKATSTIKDTEQIARAEGKIRVYAQADKMPFGFFAKQIAKANPELTKGFFFFDVDENAGTFQNICERTLSFIYFFKGQYNPDRGEINEFIYNEVTE